MLYTSLRHSWYIFVASKKILVGGIIPIAIFISILSSFALLYTNTFLVIDAIFSVKKHSVIFKNSTKEQEVDRIFAIIQKYSQTKHVQKVLPLQAKAEILKSFQTISKDLAALNIEKFPYIIEFTLQKASNQSLLDYLAKQSSVHVVISGLSVSSQIQTLLQIVNILGLLFLVMFAISLFYIVNHTIQVSFLNFSKEIEVFLILGATSFFIYFPFLFIGFLISIGGFCIGIFMAYMFFLLGIALVTFNESSFFLQEIAMFFPFDFLISSFVSFVAIGLVSSFSAIHYVTKKIDF